MDRQVSGDAIIAITVAAIGQEGMASCHFPLLLVVEDVSYTLFSIRSKTHNSFE